MTVTDYVLGYVVIGMSIALLISRPAIPKIRQKAGPGADMNALATVLCIWLWPAALLVLFIDWLREQP